MTKQGRGTPPGLSPAARQKLQELAELISQERFGAAGIPKEFTFSEIEAIGHGVGQLAAGAVDRLLQQQHAGHLVEREPCPGCGEECVVERRERPLQTRDGTIVLDEPVCRCRACERDFFPSASALEARRARV
jgi:hypothetical protein